MVRQTRGGLPFVAPAFLRPPQYSIHGVSGVRAHEGPRPQYMTAQRHEGRPQLFPVISLGFLGWKWLCHIPCFPKIHSIPPPPPQPRYGGGGSRQTIRIEYGPIFPFCTYRSPVQNIYAGPPHVLVFWISLAPGSARGGGGGAVGCFARGWPIRPSCPFNCSRP